MLVRDIETRILPVRMKADFHISYGTIDQTHNVFVKVTTDTPFSGFGEASCIAFITGDTNGSVLAAVEAVRADLIGAPVDPALLHARLDARLYANPAAKALLDMAYYDALAKEAGLPLHRFLGADEDRLTTDVTLGIDTLEAAGAAAKSYFDAGFRIFKIKAADDAGYCIALSRFLRALSGDVVLRIDANQGWSADTMRRVAAALCGGPVEYIEQPVARKDYGGLKAMRALSPFPIMADESVFDLADAKNVIENGLADRINLKLMKTGGIYPALRMADYAAANDVRCGIGCMMEGPLGLAASLAAALCHDNITEYDLDSALLVESGAVDSALRYDGPVLIAAEHPGLGLADDLW